MGGTTSKEFNREDIRGLITVYMTDMAEILLISTDT